MKYPRPENPPHAGPFSAGSLTILAIGFCWFLRNIFRFQLNRWDDAYITFRFSDHAARGLGFVWNVTGERVEGFTSFLQAILLACAERLGIPPSPASVVLGVAGVLITCVCLLLAVKRLLPDLPAIASLPIALYLIDSATAVHATSGLETHLFVAMLAAAYVASLSFSDAPSVRTAICVTTFLFLAVLARPEGVLFAAATYGALWIEAVFSSSASRKARIQALVISCAVFLLLGVAYAIGKYSYFGYLLPNPYYVKSGRVSAAGIPEVSMYVVHVATYLGIPLMLILLPAAVRWRRLVSSARSSLSLGHVLLTLAPPIVALAYYTTIIHEVGGAYRFSYPTYFYFVVAAAVVLAYARREIPAARSFMWVTAVVACLAGAIMVQRPLDMDPLPLSAFQKYHTRLAVALRETGLGSRGIVLCDAAGVIPFVSGFSHIDRVGLTDNTLSGRIPMTAVEREDYIWGQSADVYIGYEPPAREGAEHPSDDERFESRYVSDILLHRKLMTIEDRIFVTDAPLLHRRMRELRDRWIWIGEMDWPGRDLWGLRSFVYVRRDSANAGILTTALRNVVARPSDQIAID